MYKNIHTLYIMPKLQLMVVTQSRVMPDMYTRSPRAEGGHIRQSTSDCVKTYKYRHPSEDIYSLNVLGNIILLCAVHYKYNALCGVVHEICSTARSFDLRCKSVTLLFVNLRTCCTIIMATSNTSLRVYTLMENITHTI